ncbi:MAG TPA: thioredoxin TrxC [Blastocatellia bacterium]|nr:thioredoxin TrxC [Blastocatellia bacterium]
MSATIETPVIVCSSCGAKNRVPMEKIQGGLEPVCGRCKKPLTFSPHPITVTDANFAEEVERSPLPVLLDMWAEWCGPCRTIAPIIEQLAGELAGRMRVGKMNIDENPTIPSRFGVRSIPTLLVLKEGREVDRLVGAMPKQEILRRIQAFI